MSNKYNTKFIRQSCGQVVIEASGSACNQRWTGREQLLRKRCQPSQLCYRIHMTLLQKGNTFFRSLSSNDLPYFGKQ